MGEKEYVEKVHPAAELAEKYDVRKGDKLVETEIVEESLKVEMEDWAKSLAMREGIRKEVKGRLEQMFNSHIKFTHIASEVAKKKYPDAKLEEGFVIEKEDVKKFSDRKDEALKKEVASKLTPFILRLKGEVSELHAQNIFPKHRTSKAPTKRRALVIPDTDMVRVLTYYGKSLGTDRLIISCPEIKAIHLEGKPWRGAKRLPDGTWEVRRNAWEKARRKMKVKDLSSFEQSLGAVAAFELELITDKTKAEDTSEEAFVHRVQTSKDSYATILATDGKALGYLQLKANDPQIFSLGKEFKDALKEYTITFYNEEKGARSIIEKVNPLHEAITVKEDASGNYLLIDVTKGEKLDFQVTLDNTTPGMTETEEPAPITPGSDKKVEEAEEEIKDDEKDLEKDKKKHGDYGVHWLTDDNARTLGRFKNHVLRLKSLLGNDLYRMIDASMHKDDRQYKIFSAIMTKPDSQSYKNALEEMGRGLGEGVKLSEIEELIEDFHKLVQNVAKSNLGARNDREFQERKKELQYDMKRTDSKEEKEKIQDKIIHLRRQSDQRWKDVSNLATEINSRNEKRFQFEDS